MRPHYRVLADTKQQYRELFRQYRAALEGQLAGLRAQFRCECGAACPPAGHTDTVLDWMTPLHVGCGYRAWQQAALGWIEQEIAAEILRRLQAIETYKNTFSCHLCGMCCRLASSKDDYATLQAKAKSGDDFARQFTSVFLPYASREAAQAVAPEVVAAVLAEAVNAPAQESGDEEDPDEAEAIYFYHCAYLQEDNRCGLYGTDKRPALCASYPETPLSFVYERCAWKPWQEETHADTLAAHALMALCTQWADRLKAALAATP